MEGLVQKMMTGGYVGNPSQLITLRRVTLEEGKARGTEIIEVKTAGGLELDLLPDTGLDIGQVRYKGINMSFLSKNGYDSPASIESLDGEFLNNFPGGMMYTCGLRSTGPANMDHGEWHPFHGRYHSIPAEHVSAELLGDEIVVKGTIRETALFGHHLELKRTIRIPAFGTSVTVEDNITNYAHKEEEYAQIYHCNFGYPLLSENARLILPENRETVPRTAFAAQLDGPETAFEKPVPCEEERVYFQKMKEEFWAKIENPELGIRMKLTWSGKHLPVMTEWRSMGSGDYALGLEPTNTFVLGRHEERKNGSLATIRAFETIKNTLQFDFEELH